MPHNKIITHYSSLIFVFFAFFSISTWNSCDIINPPEAIPSYIQIDTMLLSTSSAQGSASHRIGAVQVSAGTELLGIFPLPTSIPVLQSGTRDINIDPIIIESGISALRDLYPFYNRYTVTGDLVEGEALQITPQTTYRNNSNFVFIENFDGGNSFVDDLDGDFSTRIEVSFDDVFEGSGSGKIVLNEAGSRAIVGTGVFYNLPNTGEDIYLEMNYKCNNNFTVGIRGMDGFFGTTFELDKLTLVPREEWNKVYISLDQEVATIGASQFQIYIKMTKSDDVPIAELVLDNIKLIHE